MLGKTPLLFFAAGLALSTSSLTAFAVPVTTLVSAGTTIEEYGATYTSSAGPANAVALSEPSPTFYGYAEAIGDNLGNSKVVSWSNAEYSHITSQVHQASNIINNTGAAQNFSFNFLVDKGSITTTANNILTPGEFLNAAYTIDILVNGSSIWHSAASITFDDNSYSLIKSGTNLNAGPSNGSTYLWGNYYSTLALGSFQNNESFTLDYYLTTSITNHFHVYDNQSCDQDSPYQEGATPNCSQPFNGNAYALIGDPNGFEYSPINSETVIPASTVPEPTSAALFFITMAGLGFCRREK